MSYKSHTTAPTRIFDHLYDPLYVTSSGKDIWRANVNALTLSAPIHIIPIYKTMFSDLPQRSRNVHILQRNPLPCFPPFDESRITKPNVIVNGKDRANFFNNPLTNFKSLNLKLDLTLDHKPRDPLPQIHQKYKTIGCQTVYREQSAQTKPWMPDAIIGKDEIKTPEIIHVANLIHDNDKLPGIFEVQIIERSRKRREWENSLPPIKTFRDWNKRRCVLEAFEWEEWVARETEIEHYQSIRYLIVKEMMADRKEKLHKSSEKKIENTAIRFHNDRERKIQKLRNSHQRSLRKLEMKHKKIDKKYKPTDIVTEYTDPASELYGPQTRFGYHPKHTHFIEDKTKFETKIKNVEQMQTTPAKLQRFIEPKIDITKPKTPIKEIQPGFCEEKYLQYLYNSLKALRSRKIIHQNIANCLEYIKTPLCDPSEIMLDNDTVQREQENEIEYQNAILLQKIIKGRAIQKAIYNGRNKCKSLILEYQSTHQLTAVNAMYATHLNKISEKHKNVLYQQSRLEGLLRAESQINDVLQHTTDSSISFLLDFLDKELTRLIDQKKSHALYLLAEKERQKREAIEARNRQIDEIHRQEFEEFFEKKLHSSNETVTQYLENVLMQGLDNIADIDARKNIRNVARQIDEDTCKSMSTAFNEMNYIPNDEEIVTDLVNNFIFPEIYKSIARRDENKRKNATLLTAHDTIYNNLTDKYPVREKLIESNENIVSSILNEIVTNIMPSSSLSSAVTVNLLDSNELINASPHKPKLPLQSKFKQSCERIVDATISDILKMVIPLEICECRKIKSDSNGECECQSTRSHENESLLHIVTNINEDLYNYVIEDSEDNTSLPSPTI